MKITSNQAVLIPDTGRYPVSHCLDPQNSEIVLNEKKKNSLHFPVLVNPRVTRVTITELFRVEKPPKTKPNHSPSTTMVTTEPCPQVPHPHGF